MAKYREYADNRLTSPEKIGPEQQDIVSAKTAERSYSDEI
jgi:hypothetical protein